MNKSKVDPDFQLCFDALVEAGIKPEIYTVEREKIDEVNPKVSDKIKKIKEISRNLDCAIGIVGGFVRDLLLGEPTEDVDFVVFKGDINELTESIAFELGGKVGKMSNRTMTTQVRFPDNLVFEFNSTRKERYEYPSRVPIVEQATIVEDLSRRDFTINALIMFDNQIIDIFDGSTDLSDELIRTTRNPDIVFHEDYLRMFRAIRFACKLNFSISEDTMNGIKSQVNNILEVPSERILNELKQSFEYNPLLAFQLMVRLCIFETMFPQIKNLRVNTEKFTVVAVFERIESELRFLYNNNVKEISPYFAIILKEVNLEFGEDEDQKNEFIVESKLVIAVEQILSKYKFSNKEKLSIFNYMKFYALLKKMLGQSVTDLRVRQFIRATDPNTDKILLLLKANQSVRIAKIDFKDLENRIKKLGTNRDLIFFDLALSGHEIADQFKVEGENIGRAKQLLTLAIMSEEISNTKEECLQYLRDNFIY